MADMLTIIFSMLILIVLIIFIVYQYFTNLRTEQKIYETQKFFDYLKISPAAKGEFGEGIVDVILSNLPKDFVKKQYQIPEINARIDFCVQLPNSDVMIPIDCKFILPYTSLETKNLELNDREIANLNKAVIDRAREIQRYMEPAITTDFVLMFIPDFVYSLLDASTYQTLADMNVIPTNTSGLLSTIFMINTQHRFILLNSSAKKFGSYQIKVSQGIRRIIEFVEKAEKQMNHSLSNMRKLKTELAKLQENVENAELLVEE